MATKLLLLGNKEEEKQLVRRVKKFLLDRYAVQFYPLVFKEWSALLSKFPVVIISNVAAAAAAAAAAKIAKLDNKKPIIFLTTKEKYKQDLKTFSARVTIGHNWRLCIEEDFMDAVQSALNLSHHQRKMKTTLGSIRQQLTEPKQEKGNIPYYRQLLQAEENIKSKNSQLLTRNKELEQMKKELEELDTKLTIQALYPKMNPGPIFQIDFKGVIKDANFAAENIFGDVKNTSIVKISGTDIGLVNKIVKTHKTYQTEIENGGKYFLLTFNYDPHAPLIFVYGSDVTKLKKAQEELKSAHASLLEREKANQMIFLNTTHELKTPIVPVKSLALALQDGSLGKLNPKQHEVAEIIVRNMDRLNKLISDILDISKFQTNAVSLSKSRISLRKIVKEAMSEFDQKFKDKNLQTILNVGSVSVFCDESRIKQVLVNLLSNAIKFTEKGSITIKATKDKKVVLVHVKDTGFGISKEHIPKLFTPFYQVKPSFRVKQVGTGLGLAICKNIIEKHGGKIWAESAGEGKGTDFCFTLPLKSKHLKRISK